MIDIERDTDIEWRRYPNYGRSSLSIFMDSELSADMLAPGHAETPCRSWQNQNILSEDAAKQCVTFWETFIKNMSPCGWHAPSVLSMSLPSCWAFSKNKPALLSPWGKGKRWRYAIHLATQTCYKNTWVLHIRHFITFTANSAKSFCQWTL